jgi:hypothetical protein
MPSSFYCPDHCFGEDPLPIVFRRGVGVAACSLSCGVGRTMNLIIVRSSVSTVLHHMLRPRLRTEHVLDVLWPRPRHRGLLLMFLMQLYKRTELSMYHFTRSIPLVSYLDFSKGGSTSIMSKINTRNNSI